MGNVNKYYGYRYPSYFSIYNRTYPNYKNITEVMS